MWSRRSSWPARFVGGEPRRRHAPDHRGPVRLAARVGEGGDPRRPGQGAERRPDVSAGAIGFEIRHEPEGTMGYRGATRPWNGGKVSDLAGDGVWFADFSDLRTPGELSRLRPRRQGPVVLVPDRGRRLSAGPARCGAGLLLPAERHTDHGAARRRLAPSPAPTWGATRTAPRRLTQGGKTLGRPRDLHRRLVRRGRPQQVCAVPGGHAVRPAVGLRAEPRGLRRRHEHPGERQRRARLARRGEVGARLAAPDAGRRRRVLQSGGRPQL